MANCLDSKTEAASGYGSRMLMIVDPQIDFIIGSLPVPGAREAMDALASFIRCNGTEYSLIAITCDLHPDDHLSFKNNGGKWPSHCVGSSIGAEIWPPVVESLFPFRERTEILYKGMESTVEEYSIVMNPYGKQRIETLLREQNITQIDICGLAGDVCVATTLSDLLKVHPEIQYRIMTPFSPSLDGGERLRKMNNRNVQRL